MTSQEPFLISTRSPYLHCCMVGYTAVVRISDLERKYPGGPRRFAEKHYAYFSRDLAGAMAMHPDDLDEMLEDLRTNGFKPGKDYCVIEGGPAIMFNKPGDRIDVGIHWLRGLMTEERFLVKISNG